MLSYPEILTMSPKSLIDKDLAVPGSKSLTNRALVVAALANGCSTLRGALIAEDSEVMIQALGHLGIRVERDADEFRVHGRAGEIPVSHARLDLRLSGTSMRFLTAMLALGHGKFVLDGNERMRERPIQDLLTALERLGTKASSQFATACPPVVVEAAGLPGGKTSIAGDRSSQYLSALLMAAPYAKNPVTIEVTGELQSKPFIDMTLKLMQDFGVSVARNDYTSFTIEPSGYLARDYLIEGDAMAAGYFWAAAAICGGRVKVTNIGDESIQGDRRLAGVLAEMGCKVSWTKTTCEVIAPPSGLLKGGSFDLNDMPDQAQTLAVLALFADSPVRISNVWNMRIKETDRLSAMHSELTKCGAMVEEGHDYLLIHPLKDYPGQVEITTYGDHRMAMAFALAGLRLPNLSIREPACVAKTFPEFFEVLATL